MEQKAEGRGRQKKAEGGSKEHSAQLSSAQEAGGREGCAELEAESAVHENTVSFKHFPYFTVKAAKYVVVCLCVCVGERA